MRLRPVLDGDKLGLVLTRYLAVALMEGGVVVGTHGPLAGMEGRRELAGMEGTRYWAVTRIDLMMAGMEGRRYWAVALMEGGVGGDKEVGGSLGLG